MARRLARKKTTKQPDMGDAVHVARRVLTEGEEAPPEFLATKRGIVRSSSETRTGRFASEPIPLGEPMAFEGLEWFRTYYIDGPHPSRDRLHHLPEVKDPPTAGQSHVFVIGRDSDKKRVTLFCPYSFQSWQVSREAAEIAANIPPSNMPDGIKTWTYSSFVGPEQMTTTRAEWLGSMLARKWDEYCRMGLQKDYAVAAMVLKLMGRPIPTTVPAVNQEALDKKESTRKGKDQGPELIKPVKRGGKRGAVVEFFLGETKSILEAMAVLGMTRSGVLTHLFGLNADHGLGYYLIADQVTLILPDGCSDPFSAPTVKAAKRSGTQQAEVTESAPDQEKPSSGKPLLDTVTALKAGSKRAAVALALLDGWKTLDEVAEVAGCSATSVKSHLHDLHTKHGVGFELSADRKRARLLAPKGWRPE